MLHDPIPTPFPRLIPLADALSVENTPLTLPLPPPTLTTARRLPITPCPAVHRTDVSDSQLLRSHDVCPTLITAVFRICDP